MNASAIIIQYEDWISSPLSIARHFGGIKIQGAMYVIVDMKHVDLVREDWITIYSKLGRDKTIHLVKNGTPLSEARKCLKRGRN